jgi:hypothetical protein
MIRHSRMGPAAYNCYAKYSGFDYRTKEIAYDMFIVAVIQYLFKPPFSGGFVL